MVRKILNILLLALVLSPAALAQNEVKSVRRGNRLFGRDDWKNSEIEYRRALVADSTSFAANYNLASSLYRQQNWQGASDALSAISEQAAANPDGARCNYNAGDVALQQKDYEAAVKYFRESLLRDPGDLDAKENYIYAKLMLQNQQQQGGGQGQNDQNQDRNQNQDQDQNQNQEQNKDQNDQNKDNQQQQPQQNPGQQDEKQQDGQPQEQKISPQQAQQMLKAVQAQEKETQDKVRKEKAAVLQSRQKEKNW